MSQKKSYCIFSAQYLPSIGGVERYTYYLAKEMIKNGNTVTIVTSQMPGQKKYEKIEEIEIYRVPCIPLMNGRLPIIKLGPKLSAISKELQRKKFDLVIINTRFYFHSLYGARFARKNKIKCITIEHGTSHLTFNNKILDVFEKIYEHTITFFMKRNCKSYYGVSKACCDWSGHFGIKSKGTLYNAVDVDEVNEIIDKPVEDYRQKLNIKENDNVISYTGRLIKEKGLIQLVDAIDHIESDQRIFLVMAGDGPLKKELEEKINEMHNKENRVVLLGRIDFKHVISLLKGSDIFCLPSDSEGFPTSVLEAIASKTFVITTYNGGARELITSRDYGIIMPDNTMETIKKEIEYVLSDNTYRKNAIDKAYQKLGEQFTFSATFHEIEKI